MYSSTRTRPMYLRPRYGRGPRECLSGSAEPDWESIVEKLTVVPVHRTWEPEPVLYAIASHQALDKLMEPPFADEQRHGTKLEKSRHTGRLLVRRSDTSSEIDSSPGASKISCVIANAGVHTFRLSCQ